MILHSFKITGKRGVLASGGGAIFEGQGKGPAFFINSARIIDCFRTCAPSFITVVAERRRQA
jgi:hypothetical protein